MKIRNAAICIVLLTLPALSQTTEKIEPLKLGSPAPDFELVGVDGKEHRLQDFDSSKILAVIFTCNHCPTAQAYEERIKQLVTDYQDQGVAVVAISPSDPKAVRLNELGYTDLSDSFEENKIRAKDHKFNFPYLYDGDKQVVSKAYGPRATPHIFIFDNERKLQYEGGFDDSEKLDKVKTHYVREAIDALLAGKPAPNNHTPTPGCSIKWSYKRDSVQKWLDEEAQKEVGLTSIEPDEVKKLFKNDTDKIRLINIWATWCGECRLEFPDLVTIHRMYGHRDFELIGLSVDDPRMKSDVLEFLQKQQAAFRNHIINTTDKRKIVEATNGEFMGAIPLTLIILPGGEIAFKNLGAINPLETKRAIVKNLGRTY